MRTLSISVLSLIVVIFVIGYARIGHGASWGEPERIEFGPGELPTSLYAMVTGDSTGSALTYCLPEDYSAERLYPLVVYVPGYHGRRGGNIRNAMDIAGDHECVVASLPLFKTAIDSSEIGDGLTVGFADFPAVSQAYGIMLERLDEVVPNLDRTRSAMVGYSNGAITTAVLVSSHDENVLDRFDCFCLVEHGMFHLTDLHRAQARDRRYLVMVGDQFDFGRGVKLRGAELIADAHRLLGIDIEHRVLKETGHELTGACKTEIGDWIFESP